MKLGATRGSQSVREENEQDKAMDRRSRVSHTDQIHDKLLSTRPAISLILTSDRNPSPLAYNLLLTGYSQGAT